MRRAEEGLKKLWPRFTIRLAMAKVKIPDAAMKYFRLTGAQGGKARAERHTAEELSRWGKMGGRPKGSGKKSEARVPVARSGSSKGSE